VIFTNALLKILSEALKKFLRGRKLEPPPQLLAGAASYG
jgi:hypothetical protein